MIPATSSALPTVQGGQANNAAAQGKPDAAVSGQSKATSGVASAANVRAETTQAVDPSRQASVAPRLRDQETLERTPRLGPSGDGPTGPPPAFQETPLQRAARTVFDPPEANFDVAAELEEELTSVEPDAEKPSDTPSLEPSPPSPTEQTADARAEDAKEARREAAARQAEAAFEAARRLEANEEKSEVDVSL